MSDFFLQRCVKSVADSLEGIILPDVQRGFSFVEALAAIAIIGIITFLAIPNILRIKEDGELNLAISRAEALNMAMASLVQANGVTAASAQWTSAGANGRYGLLAPYIAFAPTTAAAYMPAGYSVTFPTTLTPMTKVQLSTPATNNAAY